MSHQTPNNISQDDKDLEINHVEVINRQDAAGGAVDEKYLSHAQDDAARILREVGPVEYTIEDDRRVLRKLDIWVCLPMFIVYTLVHLDKSALSYAAVFDLKKEAHLVGKQYSWLGSIVYLVQLVVQPLSAYALVKFPMSWWVVGNVFCWGVCLCCMAATHNFAGLLVTRALLGGFEATISPSFIAMTQMFWRRREQTYRNTAWLMSSSVAGFIGPILTYGIAHVKSGIKPWQGIFLFLGCITLAFCPLIFWMMPNDIGSAKFLTPQEKVIAVERLRDNNTGTKTSAWKWDQAKEAVLDPKTWIWGLMLSCMAIPSSGIGTFGTLITKGFGFSSFDTILFQMPPYVLTISFLLGGTWVMNKINLRFPVVAFFTLFPVAGAAALLYVPRDRPHALLGAYYVIMLYTPLQPLVYSWANMNAAGTTKQRTVGAILFIMQCAGNVAGPQVYLEDEAPVYKTGLYTDMACWSLLFVLICSMAVYLKYLNRRQAKKRERMGRMSNVRDMSIMTLEQAAAYKRELAAAGEGEDVNAHAFDDLTDFQNPDFHYIL
ncbi:uncharacterized protein I303_102612 [Kwoniella dejecticola CBS 10117]|uniref:Allantoate transporter n=1 Tax=Kwoniella dejecticola CBS 10117 TaxID=1296121 RepID=A0A1A6A986_9TREE|nr:uncharacterized protein I303_02626 [Kwoniella dejecticola CBS 10117]OBR86617.1 hypothetical protein I303_02626 [Kwoniella dejecticola CBS 10117]